MEGDIESGEHRGVGVGKGGEQGAAEGDEPHFVSVPERADRVHEEPPFLVGLGQGMQHAHPQVETVQNGVSRQQHAQQAKPNQAK